jgi:hypothetical protein
MTEWRTPELNEDAAMAVAVMTLYLKGATEDVSLAGRLLDEMTAGPDGVARAVGGLASLCATLLALHEFDTGIAPDVVLERAALAVQQALPAPPG